MELIHKFQSHFEALVDVEGGFFKQIIISQP